MLGTVLHEDLRLPLLLDREECGILILILLVGEYGEGEGGVLD